ncbi:glycoside hydrolase family 13 protein [Pelagicoccus sp. SDUM812002]|uniref:glycoside hydrolase family 13 protein n=1 Tax=Pelagicoccus sp. SDUM812002 TaxID=3041266 RepID=UPI00280F718E|nr:glycoside hydrolase family 13 protein [Pelagicoccus sp. SDUM812002]MDQ8186651.1 glycoside hydrolase family 13 protein [Pelagicoccus sp. SDUM812002]
MLNKIVSTLFSLLIVGSATAQKPSRIEPPFWWAQMPVSELQIQLYGEGIGLYRASLQTEGVTIAKQVAVDSTNYLFLYLEIDESVRAGTVPIQFEKDGEAFIVDYELRDREPTAGRNQGFDASDLIYLMMPDRFANGNLENDKIAALTEGVDRSDPTKRQGGDIQGISQHLDYIDDLGMTAIWFTPIFENNTPPSYGGYHGYAATDMYNVDRRLGSNETYKDLISDVHGRGMKVIMDMIHNHIGLDHWWMGDPPTKDWVHDVEKYGYTNFKGTIVGDPHASQYDQDQLVKGWFVPYMPDLNQRNELLADYLIQNSIWWIEYSGIDGIRMDTYLYPYPEYMARWTREILSAYPNFNIVGEVWVETVAHESYWQDDAPNVDDGYDSNLPSVTDFPLSFAIRDGLNEKFGWTTGLSKIYYAFAQDRLYNDPNKNVIFIDNHDMSRVFEHLGKDEALFKIAYTLLLTARGIPQVYYGTELMMAHEDRGGDDEAWRQTMPGGWPDDKRNVFTISGRTEKENEVLDYMKALNHWRADTKALHRGKLLQFIPDENTFVYFRILEDEAVMVAINGSEETAELEANRFAEVLDLYSKATLAPGGSLYKLSDKISLAPKSVLLLNLSQ